MADSPLLKRLKQRAKSIPTNVIGDLLNSRDTLEAARRRVQEGWRTFEQTLDERTTWSVGKLSGVAQRGLGRMEQRAVKVRERVTAIVQRLRN